MNILPKGAHDNSSASPILTLDTSCHELKDQKSVGDDEEEEYYPMENFSMVSKDVYRGAFPMRKNFPFLKQLGMKSILYPLHEFFALVMSPSQYFIMYT